MEAAGWFDMLVNFYLNYTLLQPRRQHLSWKKLSTLRPRRADKKYSIQTFSNTTMSYSHYFPSISHTFHWNFINKYITFCKVICICCQSAMTELECMKSLFSYTQYVIENNNCSSNTFCQCSVPKISPKQHSVLHNLLKNRLLSYLVCKVHSRLGGTSFITNKYGSNSLSIWSPSTTHNSDRHFILYQFTWCFPYADFPFDIFFL